MVNVIFTCMIGLMAWWCNGACVSVCYCSKWVWVMSVVQMVYARFVLTPKK